MKPIFTLLVGVFALASNVSYAATSSAPQALDLATSKAKLRNTMNYGDCLNYSVKPCVQMCPGGLFRPPYPTVGVKFTYQEPTALAETSCLRGETELGGGFITQMMAGGAMQAPDEQKCAEGIKSPGTQITRHYNDVHIYGFSGPTRYLSSGNPLQVTQSLTCGIAGAAGLFMDYSNMLGGFQNFSLKNLGQQISQLPQKVGAQIQNSIQNISKFPSQMADGISGMVEGTVGSINDMVTNATDSLNNLGDTLNNLGHIGGDLTNIASQLQGMGHGVVADAIAPISTALSQLGSLDRLDVGTLSDLQKLDMGSLTQYAASLGVQFTAVPGMEGVASGLQGLGALDTATWQTAIGHAKAAKEASVAATAAHQPGDVAAVLAADTGRGVASSKQSRVAQLSSSGGGNPFEEPAILGSFAPIGNVPEVVERGGELQPTGRLLNSGTSQIAAETLEREHTVSVDKMAFYGKEALRVSDLILRTQNDDNACFMLDLLKEGAKEIEARTKEVRQGVEVFAKASYLPTEFVQQRDEGVEELSCVTTHAGYMLKPQLGIGMGTERVENMNCYQICDDDGDCTWHVKKGFKGSCNGNRLSQYEVDGLYPACEEQRKILNARRTEQLAQTLSVAKKKVSQAERRLRGYIQRRGVVCGGKTKNDALKPAAESKLLLATAPVESYGLSAQFVTENRPTASVGESAPAADDTNMEVAEFGGLTNTLNKVSAYTRKGGVRQGVNNMIGKRLPFGLYPAFISEATNWSEPPKMDIIGQIKMAIGGMTQAAMAPFLCMAPTYAADYGLTSGQSLSKINKMANCVGTWGAEHPSTGWAHHKDPTKSAMLVAYRGHTEAVKLGGIQGNTKGTQNFNLDYPFVKDSGKHRGSGCYNVGTGKNLQGKNLLNPDFGAAGRGTTDIADGKHIATMWKNTSCCVYFCTGILGLFPKPKVKRYY